MPSERLAAVRIAVGLYSLYYLLPRWTMFYDIARTSPTLFAPVGVARLVGMPLPPELMDALYFVTVFAAFFVTLGLRMRISGPIFAISLLTLLSFRNSWSMILHMHNGLVVHAMIIAATRSSDAWSIDSWKSSAPASSAYGWPVRLVAATTTVSYFLSGVAKVMGPQGVGWASGEALSSQIAVNAIRYDVLTEVGAAPLFQLLLEHTWIFWILGVSTLVLELGAPLAFTHRRLGQLWAVATFGLHWGIFFTMGIKFRYQMSGAAFVAFVDSEAISRWMARRRAASRSVHSFENTPQRSHRLL